MFNLAHLRNALWRGYWLRSSPFSLHLASFSQTVSTRTCLHRSQWFKSETPLYSGRRFFLLFDRKRNLSGDCRTNLTFGTFWILSERKSHSCYFTFSPRLFRSSVYPSRSKPVFSRTRSARSYSQRCSRWGYPRSSSWLRKRTTCSKNGVTKSESIESSSGCTLARANALHNTRLRRSVLLF